MKKNYIKPDLRAIETGTICLLDSSWPKENEAQITDEPGTDDDFD